MTDEELQEIRARYTTCSVGHPIGGEDAAFVLRLLDEIERLRLLAGSQPSAEEKP